MTPTEVLPAPSSAIGVDEKDPTWYQAFTLAERIQNGLPDKCSDPELAERRLSRWQEALFFSQDESLGNNILGSPCYR